MKDIQLALRGATGAPLADMTFKVVGTGPNGTEAACDIKLSELLTAGAERIEELEAAVREALAVFNSELDIGRTPYALKVTNGGKGLGYFEDILAGVSK